MKKVYTMQEPFSCDMIKGSIFLAGPTYRVYKDGEKTPTSWRNEAVDFLQQIEYNGVVCIPEYQDNMIPRGWTLQKQVLWEIDMMQNATVIAFWIPRNMETLPALTTNIEFGEYLHSKKIVVGGPQHAEKNEYLIERCRLLGIQWHYNLNSVMSRAFAKVYSCNKEN